MTIIAIANRKGGTGKTTTAVNLAAALAERGKSVLLIDTDSQANATTSLGLKPAHDDAGTLALVSTFTKLKNVVAATAVTNLSIVPAGKAIAQIELSMAQADSNWRKMLSSKLGSHPFDYVIIDTSPALGPMAINSLVAADAVIVPLQCDYLSLEGLGEFGEVLSELRGEHNPALELAGLVRTMYDPRTVLVREVDKELARHFGGKMFATAIPRNVRIAEAPSHGQPVTTFDPACAGAKAYQQLADEVLARAAG